MKKACSKALLLDLNFLVALAWPNHQFHRIATQRLSTHKGNWATCALTQLGFIRLSSNPRVVGSARTPSESAALLNQLVSHRQHVYLDSLPPPVEPPQVELFERLMGYKQTTDAYLVALATARECTFLTFDARLAALDGSSDVELLF